jgi:hypothetical protein
VTRLFQVKPVISVKPVFPVKPALMLAVFAVALPLHAWQSAESSTQAIATEESDRANSPELSVEEILTQSADPESYGDTPRCIAVRRIRSSSVLNDRHVAFKISASSYYLVQFRNRCPMLERNAAISYETRSGQLCALDSIRGINGLGATARLGPPCQIPGFNEISREQLVSLRQQLKDDRRRPALVEEPSNHSDTESAQDTARERP